MKKVKFFNSEFAILFVKNMCKLPCDINIYDGHQMFDAKSVLAVVSLDFSKEYLVECVTDNETIYKSFCNLINIFLVK